MHVLFDLVTLYAECATAIAQVAIAKGDYTMKQSRNFSFQYVYSIVLGMEQAAITWVSNTRL